MCFSVVFFCTPLSIFILWPVLSLSQWSLYTTGILFNKITMCHYHMLFWDYYNLECSPNIMPYFSIQILKFSCLIIPRVLNHCIFENFLYLQTILIRLWRYMMSHQISKHRKHRLPHRLCMYVSCEWQRDKLLSVKMDGSYTDREVCRTVAVVLIPVIQ